MKDGIMNQGFSVSMSYNGLRLALMNKYNISRNTLKNILSILQTKNAYDIMSIGKEIISPCGQKSESPRSCSFLGFLLIYYSG